MLSSASRPLLSAAASSRSRIAPGCFVVQSRLASVGSKLAFTNNGPGRKVKEKPKRDKVAGSFLPLPESQIAEFQSEENGLEDLPKVKKGVYPSQYIGKAVQFPTLEGNMMKTFGLPRNMLVDFRLLSTPCSVSRRSTVSLARRLDLAAKGPSLNDRIVMTGSSGCGKSYLMLQAVTYCAVNDWIVLYIPRAHKLVDSSTSYFYDPRTRTYLQPIASNQILQRFSTVNKKIFEKLKLSEEIVFEKRKPIPANTPLRDLIKIAASEQHLAPMILSVVLEEVGKQEEHPVLLAIDEFQALYCKTAYRDQHYEHIKSFHLSLPRLLMEYASGKKTFKRGAVIGALSSSLTQYPLGPELQKELVHDHPVDPYTKLVPGMVEYAQGLKPLRVPEKLEYDEAAALFEIWVKDRALHSAATDELFLSKYTESSGNARAFVHGGLLSTQLT